MKSYSLLICLFCFVFFGNSQEEQKSDLGLNQTIVAHQFADLQYIENPKRGFLDLSQATFLQKINPLTYVGAGLLFFYQRVISEQISADCTYQMSCSEMTKRAIAKYGIIRGALIGVNQLASCVPGNHHEHAKHKLNAKGKIINDL